MCLRIPVGRIHINNLREMEHHRFTIILLLMYLLAALSVPEIRAQRFSVGSFRQLPNDITAFINPVKDLNEDDCGLLKVEASEDFVFSTPLGIVKREDKPGEIWLWLPHGTKKLTIKHAEYGVIRDYVLPMRIDSHITYEMRIDEPQRLIDIPPAPPAVTTVVDTLVVTRTDTLLVEKPKEKLPLRYGLLATLGYGGRSKETMGGVMLTIGKRTGGFLHISTDFGRIGKTLGECGKDGERSGEIPFYTGRTRRSVFMINGGATHRLTDRVSVFEGIGYSSTALAWELAESEGGGYLRNSYYSIEGVSFEAGLQLTFGRVSVAASAVTIKGREWFGTIGVGIRLGGK